MHKWQVTHSHEGYVYVLVEVACWAEVACRVAENIDARSGHWLCGEGLPEWVYGIPLGWPAHGSDGGDSHPSNSLGSRLYQWFGWVLALPDRDARVLHRFAISDDFARALGVAAEDE